MSGAGIRTTTAAAEAAPRSWPGWLLGGLGLIAVAVAVVAAGWTAGGARLLLGALGAALAARGAALLRTEAARGAGLLAAVVGAAAIAVAALSARLTGWVLLAGVPLLLLAAALALLGRGPGARRGGQILLLWTVLVTGLLIAAAAGPGQARAIGLATVVGGLASGAVGVWLVVGAMTLRAAASRPAAPAAPAGCGGCACGAGGCGAAAG